MNPNIVGRFMPMVDTKEGDSDEQLQLVDVQIRVFAPLFFLAFLRKLTKTCVEMALFLSRSLHTYGR